MRKYSERLIVNGIFEDRNIIKCGNHTLVKNINNSTIDLLYHGNRIMQIDDVNMLIVIDDCGYGTTSTTQAINSHLQALEIILGKNNGYDILDLSYNQRFLKSAKRILKGE